jgi:hypothetical protein
MTVGILRLMLYIETSSSLKEKRMVVSSLKARLRNNFNVALAQMEDGDKWQRANLVVVGVERHKDCLNSTLSKVVNFIENCGGVCLIDYSMELI